MVYCYIKNKLTTGQIFKNSNINIDILNIIKYYNNKNEHEQNGVDEEEYILT